MDLQNWLSERRERGSEPDWRRIISTSVAGFLVVAVLFLSMSMFYRIDTSDEGVVLRFGKHENTVQPGLHWKLPWPIDIIYNVPVQRIQTLEFGFETEQPGRVTRYARPSTDDLAVAEMLTGDLNLGHVEWIVRYRVKDPVEYLFNVGNTEAIAVGVLPSGQNFEVNPAVPDTIRDVSESVMRKLVGDSSIDYVLILGRDEIATEAARLIQEQVDSFKAGVKIVTVKLQTTSPPTAQVKDAFQEVNRARQKKEQVVNEALGERNSVLPAARGVKDKVIAESEGYQNRIILATKGRISAFLSQLAEYQNAPEVTRKRLYLEAMEEILTKVGNKTIIDESVQGVLPLLNLGQGTDAPVAERGVQR